MEKDKELNPQLLDPQLLNPELRDPRLDQPVSAPLQHPDLLSRSNPSRPTAQVRPVYRHWSSTELEILQKALDENGNNHLMLRGGSDFNELVARRGVESVRAKARELSRYPHSPSTVTPLATQTAPPTQLISKASETRISWTDQEMVVLKKAIDVDINFLISTKRYSDFNELVLLRGKNAVKQKGIKLKNSLPYESPWDEQDLIAMETAMKSGIEDLLANKNHSRINELVERIGTTTVERKAEAFSRIAFSRIGARPQSPLTPQEPIICDWMGCYRVFRTDEEKNSTCTWYIRIRQEIVLFRDAQGHTQELKNYSTI